MTTPSEQLIGGVHPALNVSAAPEAVIVLSPTVPIWLSISDTAITIGRPVEAPLVLELADYSLAELVAALPTICGASLVTNVWADVRAFALAPLEGVAIPEGTAYTLGAYTSMLWRALRPMAHGLDELRALAASLAQQIDIRRASGPWLDLWGLVWALARLPDEDDSAYRNRIIYTLTLPRANNRALEVLILRAFGRAATVRDGDIGGLITMNDSDHYWGPTAGTGVWGPQQYGFFSVTMDEASGYSVDQLVELIRQYKAAGTTFAVNTRYAPTAEIFFADVAITWE